MSNPIPEDTDEENTSENNTNFIGNISTNSSESDSNRKLDSNLD